MQGSVIEQQGNVADVGDLHASIEHCHTHVAPA